MNDSLFHTTIIASIQITTVEIIMSFIVSTVRSFGTEDRETAYPIMPQPTVYDYILFRGSDIKDIRVVNNITIHNDPAIMQMQMNQQPGFPSPLTQNQPTGPPMSAQQFGPFGNPLQLGAGPQNVSQPQQVENSLKIKISLKHIRLSTGATAKSAKSGTTSSAFSIPSISSAAVVITATATR